LESPRLSGILPGLQENISENGRLNRAASGDLARRSGSIEMTIVNWEKGKTKPDKKIEKLRTILEAHADRWNVKVKDVKIEPVPND